MVYGVAFRQTGDRDMSDEITQNVFSRLSLHAKHIRNAQALPAWLHSTALNESFKALRSEIRRKKRMQHLMQASSIEKDGVEAWQHMALDIDEALNALPTADQEIIFSRFYEGKSFREIAAESKRTEASCQKHVSRCIAKLRKKLSVRGHSVSTVAIGVGVGASLKNDASAEAISKIFTDFTVPSTSPATHVILSTLIMKKSTLIVIGVIAILTAISTVSGYLIGSSSQKENMGESSLQEEGRKYAQKSNKDDRATSRRSKSILGGSDKIKNIVLNNLGVLEAASSFDELDEAYKQIKQQFAKLSVDELREAIEMILAFNEREMNLAANTKPLLRWHAVEVWATKEGQGAAEYTLEHSEKRFLFWRMKDALSAWTRNDPNAAYVWYSKALEERKELAESSMRTGFWDSIITTTADHDLGKALSFLEKLEDTDQKQVGWDLSQHFLLQPPKERSTFIAQVKGISNSQVSQAMIKEIEAGVDVELSKSRAVAFDESYTDPEKRVRNPNQYYNGAKWVAQSWSHSDPKAATEWFFRRVSPDRHQQFVDEFVKPYWEAVAPEAAYEWLQKQGLEKYH